MLYINTVPTIETASDESILLPAAIQNSDTLEYPMSAMSKVQYDN